MISYTADDYFMPQVLKYPFFISRIPPSPPHLHLNIGKVVNAFTANDLI